MDVCNLTSFGLAGVLDPIELDKYTFISGNPSFVSLGLSYCSVPERAQLSQVAPVEIPELKTLRLMGVHGIFGFPGPAYVPASERFSSLRISTRKDPI